MTLLFQLKRVYGKLKFYPLDIVSQTYISIAKKVCLSDSEIKQILKLKSLGVDVELRDEAGEKVTFIQLAAILKK